MQKLAIIQLQFFSVGAVTPWSPCLWAGNGDGSGLGVSWRTPEYARTAAIRIDKTLHLFMRRLSDYLSARYLLLSWTNPTWHRLSAMSLIDCASVTRSQSRCFAGRLIKIYWCALYTKPRSLWMKWWSSQTFPHNTVYVLCDRQKCRIYISYTHKQIICATAKMQHVQIILQQLYVTRRVRVTENSLSK